MLYTKYESLGPCSFRQEDFFKLHFENLFFDPVTILIADHPETISVEFGQIPISGSREEVV